MNLVSTGAFSGSLGGPAVFCPTRPPLYPFILALTWKIAGSMSLLPVRLIQGICYLLTLYFISRISTMVSGGDRKYGIYSALFASAVPFATAAAHVILTESLTLFFLTIAAFFAVRFRSISRRASLVALGTSLGLLILQRPTFIPIPALFLGYVLLSPKLKRKEIVPVCLLVLLPLGVIVFPWTLYARSETGSWSLVRTGAGFNLMTGIIQDTPSLLNDVLPYFQQAESGATDLSGEPDSGSSSNGDIFVHGGHVSPVIARRAGFCISGYISTWRLKPPAPAGIINCDRFLGETAFAWIKQNPLGFLRILGRHVRTLLFGNFQLLVYQKEGEYFSLLMAVLKWLLYISFVSGTALLLKRRRYHILFFPLAIPLYIIIVHSPMHSEARYFIYAYTFMTISIPALFAGGAGENE